MFEEPEKGKENLVVPGTISVRAAAASRTIWAYGDNDPALLLGDGFTTVLLVPAPGHAACFPWKNARSMLLLKKYS